MDKDKQNREAEEELEEYDLEVKPFDDNDEEEEFDEEEVFIPSAVERKFDKKSKKAAEKKAAERKERNKKAKEERKKALKKYIPLYIVTGLFVVFAAVYFGFKLLEPDDPMADIKDETAASYDYLVYYDPSSITRLDFAYDDGYEYTVKISRYIEGGKAVTEYKVPGKEQFKFNDQEWGNMLTALYSVTSSTKVTSKAEDLSIYGLDVPKAKVTYYYTNNKGEQKGVTLLIGNTAPVGTGTYTMVEGADSIYVCGAADVDYIVARDYHYRDMLLVDLPDYTNQLEEIKITKNGSTLAVRAPSSEEKKQLDYVTTFRIEEPIDFPANGVYVNTRLMKTFESISAVSVVEDFPKDLSVYGLSEADEPIVIEFTEFEHKKTTRITLGNYTGEDKLVYGKISGETSVYVFDMAIFEGILALTYNDLMDMTIWLHNIADIDRVDMMFNGENNVLAINHNDGEISGTLDGEEIIPGNVKALVTRVLQIYLFDVYDVDNTDVGDVRYSINIVKTDGSEHLMELREITSRKFAVFLNGEEKGYYVTSSDIKNLMDGIAGAKAGDKLSYTM